MKLKTLFFILSFLLVSIWVILLAVSFSEKSFMFYITEAIITISLIVLMYFYRKVITPLNSIANGMDLLREQDFSSRLSPVGQKEADRIVEMFNGMMGQLKNERLRLREQNHFLDLLIKVSPMGVVILNFDEEISMINQAGLQFLGFSSNKDVIGRKIGQLESHLAEEISNIPKDSSKTVRLSDSMIYKCSRLSFVDRGFAHPFILIESLTSEVVKAEKKAYEKVIRMIAHEVNNTAAGITSALDTLGESLDELNVCYAEDKHNGEDNYNEENKHNKEDKYYDKNACNSQNICINDNNKETDELKEIISVCSERCLSMSRFITKFANVVKIPEPQLEISDINEKVLSCKMFMESICKDRNIILHTELCNERPKVKIDSVLFEQVLVNIIKNSAESIDNNGDIFIKTYIKPADTTYGFENDFSNSYSFSSSNNLNNIYNIPNSSSMMNNDTLCLEIADNGSGISREVESKLFSPFFSTKPNGQGLGLIFIREVLTKHNCSFSLRTYPDGITRFIITWKIVK